MHIAVCDDEKVYTDLVLKFIRNCIADYEDEISEIDMETFSSGEQLVEACSQGKKFDLIFLDIKMTGMNGFEAARFIRGYDDKTIIIFITSLVDYVFGSFEFKPFWYLIKPVTEEKFKHVFLKALGEIKNDRNRKYSFFTRENGLENIEINKIMYLESLLRRIIIYTSTNQFTYYASITAEEEKLKKYDFIRIHKSYLVNMLYIQRINKNNVVLKNGVVLPLSEHRFKLVFDSFTSYLARCSI
ncbi:MAG: LytTR family DNA-binding domain-containing protein [Clostridia bacterium]|nr:LytTR family DNA-binding domain-containing protein [Clostridia bacterium]